MPLSPSGWRLTSRSFGPSDARPLSSLLSDPLVLAAPIELGHQAAAALDDDAVDVARGAGHAFERGAERGGVEARRLRLGRLPAVVKHRGRGAGPLDGARRSSRGQQGENHGATERAAGT